jgi:hypothetical protein
MHFKKLIRLKIFEDELKRGKNSHATTLSSDFTNVFRARFFARIFIRTSFIYLSFCLLVHKKRAQKKLVKSTQSVCVWWERENKRGYVVLQIGYEREWKWRCAEIVVAIERMKWMREVWERAIVLPD